MKTNMSTTTKRAACLFAVALSGVSLPVTALAQEHKSPLADAPAIRHRVELREHRFELGAGMGTSLGQDYYHAVMVNARLGIHLTDWLAISGMVGHNLTANFKTAFHDELISSLAAPRDPMMPDRAPDPDGARSGMNKIGQVFAGQAELVPFTGKFALFNSLFMNYDFYAFGGVGFINFKADAPCAAAGPSCAVTGMKLGPNVGFGLHGFINDLVAINLEVRDILVRNNPAGRDTNGDGVANKDDLSWDSNVMMALNVMFFLPGKAAVSD
jgi:hypothetical protein